jgi:hypothetical protein
VQRERRPFLDRGGGRRFFASGGGLLDRDDLVVVHQPGREQAARLRVRLQIGGKRQTRGGGERLQRFRFAQRERRGEQGHPLAARRLGQGLLLLGRQPFGERRRNRVGEERKRGHVGTSRAGPAGRRRAGAAAAYFRLRWE